MLSWGMSIKFICHSKSLMMSREHEIECNVRLINEMPKSKQGIVPRDIRSGPLSVKNSKPSTYLVKLKEIKGGDNLMTLAVLSKLQM